MTSMKPICWKAARTVASVCWVASIGAGCIAARGAESNKPGNAVIGAGRETKTDPTEEIFTNGIVLRLSVEIPGAELNKLRKANRTYVRCTVREGDRIYNDVGVHLKGAAGSFRGIDDPNPALSLNFDKFREHQRFHGLDKIHLNNSVQDPSYLDEYICGELFRAAGVPASRVTHARLELNGRDRGLYVVKEGFDKTFLSRYFKNTKGNLYDGGFLKEITDGLQKTSGDDSKDQNDLKALAEAAREPDPAKRMERLEKRLDLERFISFIAMELMVWHWDGYAVKKNNYRVYHDPGSNKMVFFPHGMDQMFWEPDGPILPNFDGLVARAVVQSPEGRRRYRERMGTLLTDVFKVEVLTNKVLTVAARVRPVLAGMSKDVARGFDGQVRILCERIAQRAVSIERQLAIPEPDPIRFDQAGVARLSGWRPQGLSGTANLEKTKSADGKNTLRITATGPTSASWRTQVVLEAGRYQFEGLARAARIVPIRDQGGTGAWLRISGSQPIRPNKLSGDAGWTKLGYAFDVPSSGMEIVLVCELRAAKGDVWFDADSLKLVRRGN